MSAGWVKSLIYGNEDFVPMPSLIKKKKPKKNVPSDMKLSDFHPKSWRNPLEVFSGSHSTDDDINDCSVAEA